MERQNNHEIGYFVFENFPQQAEHLAQQQQSDNSVNNKESQIQKDAILQQSASSAVKQNISEMQYFEVEQRHSSEAEETNDKNNQIHQIQIQIQPNLKSNNIQTAFNLVKAYIGAGILGMPHGFQKSGYLLSSICLLFIAILVYYSTNLMLKIVNDVKKPQLKFKDLYSSILGAKYAVFYNACLLILQMGCCAAYVIFFTDFFEIVFQTKQLPSRRIIYVIMSLIIIIPMVLIDTYHLFTTWNKIANTLTAISLLVVTHYNLDNIFITKGNSSQIKSNAYQMAHPQDLPSFLGIAIFTFECIPSICAIRNSMKIPSDFQKIFQYVSVYMVILYIIFSTLCCISMGDDIEEILLFGLQEKRSYFIYVQAAYAFVLVLSYPIQFYPCISVIDEMHCFKKYIERRPTKLRKYTPRLLATLLIFIIALCVPNFAALLNLLGSGAGIFIQFVFPIIAFGTYFRVTITRKQRILHFVILVIGAIAGVFAFIDSIRDIFKFK